MKSTKVITLTTLTATLFACGGIAIAQEQPPAVAERVAALKASLEASQAALKQYEWIETTVVSLKGQGSQGCGAEQWLPEGQIGRQPQEGIRNEQQP